MRATAAEIKSIAPQYVLPLGDLQYDDTATQGTVPPLSYYQRGYDPTWGSIASSLPGVLVRPVPGSHDYGDVGENLKGAGNGSTYFANFGPSGLNALPSSVTGSATDWYSYDVAVKGLSLIHI